LHSKIYFEGDNGNRFVMSGYYGGDDTFQQAERLYRSFSSSNGSKLAPRPVASSNNWKNGAGSLQYQQWIGNNLYSNTTTGLSIYQTAFSKDDFTYIDYNQRNRSFQTFIFPFENKSILNEIKFEEQLEYDQAPWLWTGGVAYYYFMGQYYEDSFDRPGFFSSQRSHKLDAYLQLDFTGLDFLDVFAGSRIYYYSNGTYLKWSPRVKLTLFPKSIFSISGGYSRNYQFLNRISLSNTVTSDVWILAGADQPPTSDSYYSAGVYLSPSKHFHLQLEGYYKEFENLRLHEINAYSLSSTFNNNPWYVNNKGTAKGLEFTLRNKIRFLTLTQTFTISKMTLSNPLIKDGKPFYADWDRTYRYSASMTAKLFSGFSLYLSWMYATGTPNKLAVFGPQNEKRLGDYRRADISAEYTHSLKKGNISLSATLFNVFNRQNPWYRELAFVINRNTSPRRFSSVPVNVYDIGFQPSFNISVTF
ncbi:MAG TPA: TonB-dependent receptor, partial [Balneolaceae bacterium]|nr:TonB-dependent receptor [Balneolaceae bacterium]